MIAEISSLIASSRTAYDIAKGLTSVYVDDKVKKHTSELISILLSVQTDALAVQSNHQELLKEKDNLEKKIVEFEKWAETERQYELKEIAPVIFVYSYKEGIEFTEPKHWLCTNCWKDKIKSIIRLSSEGSGSKKYICPNCKDEFYIRHGPSGSYSPNRDSGPHGWMGA